MRISDWSSDVCSSDLVAGHRVPAVAGIDLVVAGVVVVVRPLVAGMVLLIGAREAARYRLGAAGDEVVARAGLDGVVAGVVVVAELGVVLDRKSTRLNSSH